MSKLTITEALAEIKTITARVKKKREGVIKYFGRDSRLRDPMADEGGSKAFVTKELQAVRDLEERQVKIRGLIQASNLSTDTTVNGQERCVATWLNWRREISQNQRQFLAGMTAMIDKIRDEAIKNKYKVTEQHDSTVEDEVIINISESGLRKQVDDMEKLLGDLDGRLSLLNATTTIEIAG